MVRPSEAAGARWNEIDIENKLWNIAPDRMKKRRPHSVPLTKQTLELLEFMKPMVILPFLTEVKSVVPVVIFFLQIETH